MKALDAGEEMNHVRGQGTAAVTLVRTASLYPVSSIWNKSNKLNLISRYTVILSILKIGSWHGHLPAA